MIFAILYFGVLAWNRLFTPFWGIFFTNGVKHPSF